MGIQALADARIHSTRTSQLHGQITVSIIVELLSMGYK